MTSNKTAKSSDEMFGLNSKNVTEWLTTNVSIFIVGIVDTVSLHKTLPILVNNRPSFLLTLQILATNTALLLGSIYFYEKGVGPLLGFINTNVVNSGDIIQESYNDKLMWVLYQSLWLLPICGLCYGCSMVWYQDLADSTFRYLKGVPKSTPLTKSVGHALYGTLVWLSAFVQVKLLAMIVPMLFAQVAAAVELFFVGLNSTVGNQLLRDIIMGMKHSILMWIRVASFGSRLVGLALLCLMYGWYGFDPKWIASGMDPDERFGILERHWAYFVGFGFPYVLLMENTSFFVGYGVFLALFPFCIMLGSVCDYTDPYAQYMPKKSDTLTLKSNTLPVFKTAQNWTLLAIKYIDQKSFDARKKRSTSASGSSSSTSTSTGSSSRAGLSKVNKDKKTS
eukprot:CAMPEP_0184978260 /NCGR_PEP_ID=MMETSP1098-20130426/8821_1 /TAXON_ID=89044 /ORGANISM="Spumella elongata, Strain CCAP 955/1" /LENGTH=393 /DNA_ID=CAMNT_0027501379 /DNA_START=61 /DNA_END=1242 /DNA_ORIENTATION=-